MTVGMMRVTILFAWTIIYHLYNLNMKNKIEEMNWILSQIRESLEKIRESQEELEEQVNLDYEHGAIDLELDDNHYRE